MQYNAGISVPKHRAGSGTPQVVLGGGTNPTFTRDGFITMTDQDLEEFSVALGNCYSECDHWG
ncbi:hypothetical protein C0Q70_03218 [Pomacea canaliculata]|uniref:Uncharacterized protein n=1 Tax=Pomacea canaliculata TaxID=400727 RepID=A0A2T7PS66_POMCA|nr:hypothetical protein C0Q70_03218 [Pomacea canaliculata]